MRAQTELETDVLVIGAGLAGICASIQSARLGADTVLAEKSLVLGGNSGPDGGVHPSGAHRFHPYAAETGIIEEITERAAWMRAKTASADLHYNTSPLWDQVLDDMLSEAGVLVLRSHYAREPVMEDRRIRRVILEDTGTYTTRSVAIRCAVIDASGDGTISALAGAAHRMGREAKSEYGERCAPAQADRITMGSSLVAIVRKTDKPVEFIPPAGTPPFFPGYGSYPVFSPGPKDDLYYFFPTETGGQLDTILDEAEIFRTARRLLFSAWNYVKNEKYAEASRNWELLWVGPRVLKRESRRFFGDYTLTQNDVESGRVFDDAIAYGGFAEDIHYPREGSPEYVKIVYYGVPPIYTIPYRCIYSRDVGNLLFASRLLSVSHMAHGTVRLQRTLSAIGQAAGCAAALMKKYGVSPAEIGRSHIGELRQLLLSEDASIPGAKNEDPLDLARSAAVTASSERAWGEDQAEKWIAMDKPMGVMLWDFPERLESARFLLDNTGSRTVTVRTVLLERAYPQKWQFKDVGTVQKGFPYEKAVNEVEWADNNDAGIFREIRSISARLKPGRNHLEFPFHTQLLPKDETSDEERYVILLHAGPDVRMAAGNRFCACCRRVEEGDGGYTAFGDSPVFSIMPRLPYGEAANVIDGVSRRFSNNPFHGWMADAHGKEPQFLEFSWETLQRFSRVQITFDTLERTYREMPLDSGKKVSPRLVRDYRIEAFIDGRWETLCDVTDNFRRFRRHTFAPVTSGRLRILIRRVWDEETPAAVYEVRVY